MAKTLPISTTSSTGIVRDSLKEALLQRDAHKLEGLLKHTSLPQLEARDNFRTLHMLFATESLFNEKFENEAKKCAEILLKAGADVNGKDKRGFLPLFVAIDNGWHKAANVLLKYNPDTTVFLKDKKMTLAKYIALRAPDVFLEHLNNMVEIRNAGKKEEKLIVDFGPLVQFPTNGSAKNFCETEFLYKIVEKDKNNKLFDHPVVQLFLQKTYLKFRPQIYISILLHVLTIILFTAFIYNVYVTQCPYGRSRESQFGQEEEPTEGNETTMVSPKHDCNLELVHRILASLLAGIWLIWIVPELQALRLFRHNYFSISTVPWLILYVLWPLTLWPAIYLHDQRILTWRYAYAAETMFLVWALSIVQLSKVESFAMYCRMFAEVAIKILILSVLFAPLFVGFCLSFFVMDTTIGDKSYNFIGLLSQMAGGPDYESIFTDDSRDTPTYTTIAVLLFIIFMVLMCIVFINFLLALTTGDVDRLWRMAKKTTFLGQVRQVYLYDKTGLVSIRNIFGKGKGTGSNMGFTYRLKIKNSKYPRKLLLQLKVLAFNRTPDTEYTNKQAAAEDLGQDQSEAESIQTIRMEMATLKNAVHSLTMNVELLVVQGKRMESVLLDGSEA